MPNSFWPHGLEHARLPCPSPSPRACSNSCPSSWWCHPTISSSVIPFSSCLQSFPASGSFLWVSSLHQVAKVLELQHQSFQWIFWVGLLAVKGLSRVFSSTTIWKHQFFSAWPSLWSKLSHPYLTGESIALTRQTFCQQSDVSAF